MFYLSKFAERLKEVMDDKPINAPALGKALHTDRTNITRYLRGERAPQYANFLRLLDFFSCSADYLLGLVDYPPENAVYHAPSEPFSVRLRRAMNACDVSRYSLENAQNFASSAVQNWLTGKKLPTVESLAALSEFMGCSVDYLIGRID